MKEAGFLPTQFTVIRAYQNIQVKKYVRLEFLSYGEEYTILLDSMMFGMLAASKFN